MSPDPPTGKHQKTQKHPVGFTSMSRTDLTVITYVTHSEYFRNNLTTEIRKYRFPALFHFASEWGTGTETGNKLFENWMETMKIKS